MICFVCIDSATYAYTALSLVGKGLAEINDQIQRYEHIRDLDLSGNKLPSVDKLRNLKWLQSLTARDNKIELCHLLSETKAQLCFLTSIDLAGNKIQKLRPILARKLLRAVLDNNVINEVDFSAKGHDELKFLSMNKNQLENLEGITNLKSLKELHLNENQITSLRGISGCNSLRVLNLNQNKLEGFDEVPNLPALEEISMTHCPITSIAEVGKLIKYKNLRSLNLSETPLAEEQGEALKKEVLILLDGLNLVSFNAEEVTKEEIDDAK